MVNFFDDERYECDKCHSQIFEVVEQLILKKENNEYIKQPYNKVYRCVTCNKMHNVKVRD